MVGLGVQRQIQLTVPTAGKSIAAASADEGGVAVADQASGPDPLVIGDRRAARVRAERKLSAYLRTRPRRARVSAESASSTRREEGVARPDSRPLDKVRALQWALYRCAKQDPEHRFHALYGHILRRDVLWRAWSGVCTNRGAPGVDGVTVDAVAAAGVEEFLRVMIPKPGRSGEFRPLSIPTVADRVVMTAAKLVLEPVFEADFLPVSYGFRPKRSAIDACESVRVEANRGREWVLEADIRDWITPVTASSGCSRICPSASPQISPTGSPVRSWPRAALLRIPPISRARNTCSSASLMIPSCPAPGDR